MRLLYSLILISVIFWSCRREKPKSLTQKKPTLASVQKPVVWDTLMKEMPDLKLPIKIGADTYFKGAIEFEYAQKFLAGNKMKLKESEDEILTAKDERSTSFYYIGKYKVNSDITAMILYNGILQEFYCVTFDKQGKYLSGLEIAKIKREDTGSEILECQISSANSIQIQYQFLSKDLKVPDIPLTKMDFAIQSSGLITELNPKNKKFHHSEKDSTENYRK